MKIAKNEKGMTLVEIIVATAVFGVTCATLFTSILFAVRQNRDSYFAGKEIQMQMNSAERYNSKKSAGGGSVYDNKVIKYKFSATRTNDVQYAIDFTETTDGVATGHDFDMTGADVKSYMAIKGVEDRAAEYQMRFFETEMKDVVDPPEKYWLNIFNYTGTDLERGITINEGAGVGLFSYNGTPIPHEKNGIAMANSSGSATLQVGVDLTNYNGTSDILLIGEYANEFFSGGSYTVVDGRDLLLTKANINDYKEYDSEGNETGYINIFYDGDELLNEEQMNLKHPGSVG